MDKPQILQYSDKYKDLLINYMKRTFPSYSNDYINYCIKEASSDSNEGTSFIIMYEGRIIGCHMFYNTKALINGEERDVRWGHDTFIDENFRKISSIEFIMAINQIPAFGIGVSDANKKIQESIRTRFISGLFTFFMPNVYSLLLGTRLSRRIEGFKPCNTIKIKDLVFERIYKPEDIKFINSGYWYKISDNVDFIRDEYFLNNRFFNNPAFNYYMYTCRTVSCYFVVRPIVFHRIPVLLLVDFRYDETIPKTISSILKACARIAKNNCLGGLVTLSNDFNVISFFSKKICMKRETTLLANRHLKLKGNIQTNVTAADADVDYMYQ